MRKLGVRRIVEPAFAALALGSLLVGLLVVIVLVTTTVLRAGHLTAMHTCAEVGLSLSLRTLQVEIDGERRFLPYVLVAQVEAGKAAEAFGMDRGDAIIAVAGKTVERPGDVWEAVTLGSSTGQISFTWVPKRDRLLGSLRAVPIPDRPGEFRVTVAQVAGPARAAGLEPGDILVAVRGIPIIGTREAWEAIVVASRAGSPVPLTIERAGQILTVDLMAQREAALPLVRSWFRAWWSFLTRLGDPRYPEQAGLASAFVGSLLVVLVMMMVAFPVGIGAAIYLEEYARRTLLTEVLQILISNLAGVPSAIYGIIGLEILARTLNLGRSVLAGGITLGLLVLPMMIIAAREALRTVPRWVREAAYSVGATPWQVIGRLVFPYALPGIATGMILSVARALGEAAPLLLLGAFLYVNYVPKSIMDSFTVVPLQIFDWATKPQDGFAEIAAAAIAVLCVLLLSLNGVAIWFRNRYQRRWI